MSPTAGVSLKPLHYRDALDCAAVGLWFEIHPENYMCAGGPRLAWLEAIRERHPLSLHGVGLSLAADERPDGAHLAALRHLSDRFEPFVMSEHLAWSQRGGVYRPDLLPFPRTNAALRRVCENVATAQDALGRRLLIENPSHYLPLKGNDWNEIDFLAELACRTGCGLLLDVNNVFVSAHNLGIDAESYIDAFPEDSIGEIHLAGCRPDGASTLIIDTHGEPIGDPVWRLYERLIQRIGARPTLIERDDNIPAFTALLAERDQACARLHAVEKRFAYA